MRMDRKAGVVKWGGALKFSARTHGQRWVQTTVTGIQKKLQWAGETFIYSDISWTPAVLGKEKLLALFL